MVTTNIPLLLSTISDGYAKTGNWNTVGPTKTMSIMHAATHYMMVFLKISKIYYFTILKVKLVLPYIARQTPKTFI